MLGFQDFTNTNSYGYSGFYPDPMTTALLSDNSPYTSYATIAGATPASNANNANTDLDVVNSLLAEAFGVSQGADTSVATPDGNSPSWDAGDTWYGGYGDTANVGNVGVGHQTGDPEVDSLLNQTDQIIADNRSWLDSLPKDPLTGMPANSESTFDSQVKSVLDEAKELLAGGGDLLNLTGGNTSMLPLFQSVGQDVSTILNPNTTDAQLNQINSKNQRAGKIYGNYAKLEEMKNNNNKSQQYWDNKKLDSYRTFGSGPVYGTDWEWIGYWGSDGSYWDKEEGYTYDVW